MNTSTELNFTPAPDYAGAPLTRWTLTVNDEHVFQDVDQWGLPNDGSPSSELYDNLCDLLIDAGHLDADALKAH